MAEERAETVMEAIIRPTVAGMKADGRPYKGILYAGLMIEDDRPQLIEYNVRFGDPECQVLMALLMSDILTALIAAYDGVLASFDLRWRPGSALTVVMAANGYPGSYEKGDEIKGVDELVDDDLVVFHAGTKRDDQGRLLANGGRVLNITGMGPTVSAAQQKAYEAVRQIDWPGGFCRRDIGWREVAREASAPN